MIDKMILQNNTHKKNPIIVFVSNLSFLTKKLNKFLSVQRSRFINTQTPQALKLNKQSRKIIYKTDKKFTKFKSIKKIEETTNGISLNDIMIIKNLLFFAKLTKDKSYEKIIKNVNLNPNLKNIIEQNKLNK